MRGRPRAPAFPGLPLALDPDGLRGLLSETLPECREGLGIERVSILNVQYHPQQRCSVLYALKLRRREGGRSLVQWLTAELLPAGDSPPPPDRRLAARYRASGGRPLRSPVLHLPAAHLVCYAFPYDPALPALVDACDPRLLREQLGRSWRTRGVRPRDIDVAPLGYTPGARAALALEVLSESRDSGLPELRRLVGKLDRQRSAATVFARGWAVWREARRRVHLAPPVGYLPGPDLSLQERLYGERLSDQAGTGEFIGHVRQLARGVAALHDMALPMPSRRASLQCVKAVHRWSGVLAELRPRERQRALALRDRLTRELESRARITGPLHGDLHPSNVLVCDGRVALIDLDNMVLGDRLLDVGRFLSALRTSSLRIDGTLDGLADAREAFLEQYLRQTGEDERRARLFEAAALLTSAATGFRLQRAGWEETADRLIDECERNLVLAGAGSSGGGAGVSSSRVRGSSANGGRVDRVGWAVDGQYVGALLAPSVRRAYDVELDGCRVQLRGETHRYHRLRYVLTGWRRGERWKATLDGFLWRDRSGRSENERLAALRESLGAEGGAPLLPRPVAYLPELRLQVLENHTGRPLLELLGDGDRRRLEEAVDIVGRALASLHATPIELGKERAPAVELDGLRSAAASGVAESARARAIAEAVLENAERAVADDGGRRGPVLRGLSPRKLRMVGRRVAVLDVADATMGHPFLDAADLVAELVAAHPAAGDAHRVAERFRAAYLADEPDQHERIQAFEAAALLRGSWRARAAGDRHLSDRLLDAAAVRVGAVALEACR
ncbi:MAG TPA: phosphotransferase [Thermoanaerobaculia bacterium]|nr:phosphotransferase [Thermoanaerobaculia bacterium]